MATFLYRLDALPQYLKDNPYPPERPVTRQLLREVNKIRANSGRGGKLLVIDPRLDEIAFCRSQEQATEQRMSHDGFASGSCGVRNYSPRGENVAMGYPSPKAALERWRQSPDHLNNMTNPQFTRIGIAVAYDTNGRPYYTMELAG